MMPPPAVVTAGEGSARDGRSGDGNTTLYSPPPLPLMHQAAHYEKSPRERRLPGPP